MKSQPNRLTLDEVDRVEFSGGDRDRDGFLGINDDYLQDNSGAFRVIVYS